MKCTLVKNTFMLCYCRLENIEYFENSIENMTTRQNIHQASLLEIQNSISQTKAVDV